MRLHLPIIGITMGDPAGIGPEIIVKALTEPSIYDVCRPVVLGDPQTLSSALRLVSGDLDINALNDPAEAASVPGQMDLLPISIADRNTVQPAKPTLAGGKAMVTCIIRAVELARENRLEAVVTCPISKILMHRAGYMYDGHTQLISHLTGTNEYVMMLAGENLRVALVTIHCALRDVPVILNTEMVHRTIVITMRSLVRDFGLGNARLAVAALNPHAGESGLFGTEEHEIIQPAVHRAQKEGYRVSGPYPPDTVFHRAASGRFDAVIAMYHDQGLIPLKLLHFSDAVNVTLGLPIVRTSVDHGTAYDIAGTGRADASSLKSAIRLAARMVENRKRKA